MALNPTQRPRVSSERIRLDAKPLQDGDEQLRERKLFHFNLAIPARIRVDPSTRLIFFIAFTEFEIPAVAETKVLATGGDERIVP